jgi:uncharacterized protein (DUF427 family)
MKATYKDTVIAEASKEDLIYIEGNWYFPLTSVSEGLLEKTDTRYTCPWKGVCQYYNVKAGDETLKDNAFGYPEPAETAISRVKKDFSKHVAFWQDVTVSE